MGEFKMLRRALPKRYIEWRASRCADPVERLRYLRRAGAAAETPRRKRRIRIRWFGLAPVVCIAFLMMPLPTISDVSLMDTAPPLKMEQSPADANVPRVWLVDTADGYEEYSNGLRIDTTYEVAGNKRPYPVYDRNTLELLEWRSGPVGIVYHTTESNIAPFAEDHNRRLQLLGQYLLQYIKDHKAYHYVIDRFGRVHRVVRETDTANHAGYSVWADGDKLYVNVNPSFIGIAFESGTEDSSQGPETNQAQIHAARILTAMLRSKYGIPARNCVTHAQVSVAPPGMRLGNHIDWAAAFPFGEIGLGNNYAIASPAVAAFGFRYDADFLKATSEELWQGVVLGEDQFRQQAALRHESVAAHRAEAWKRYREIIKALEDVVEAVEKTT